MKIRSCRTMATIALASVTALAGAQGAYPERPVMVTVPIAAGGGTDTLARFFAERLASALKQPFVVENKPGANGILGVDQVARASPDGYRLLFTYATAIVVNPHTVKKLPYDPQKDLTPIAQVGRTGNLLVVNPQIPAKTLPEFVAHVRARAGSMSYCSWGNGSGGHLTMESLIRQAKLSMTHVPYKGAAACVQDIIAGNVQGGFTDIGSGMELVRAGKLRALAVSGPSRVPMLPDVPTLTESGYPFTTYSWFGLFAPAGTPPPVIARLNAATREVMQDPATIQRMREFNITDLPATTPRQFADTVRQDLVKWGELVHILKLQPE